MNILILFSFLLYFWSILYVFSDEFNLEKLRQDSFYIALRNFSYVGMIIKIKELGYDYPVKKYFLQSFLLVLIVGVMSYITTNTIIYSLILVCICVFLLPFYNYLNVHRCHKQLIEDNLFAYVSTALIYLKENAKTSIEIIEYCLFSLSNPVKKDLQQVLEEISETSDFEKSLDYFEKKYPHTIVKNLHNILKSKYKEGAQNLSLYGYLYENVENYELLISEYRNKFKANRGIFYFMILLEFLSIYMIVTMFGESDIVNLKSEFFKMIIWIYYIMNILTIIVYEKWCSSNHFTE